MLDAQLAEVKPPSGRSGLGKKVCLVLLNTMFCLIAVACLDCPAAETISDALAQAYLTNPNLNQQRAGTRAADEVVAKVKSGYRPQIKSQVSWGYQRTDGSQFSQSVQSNTLPTATSLTIDENLYNGNRTTNGVKQAESRMLQSREQIRAAEQDTLLNGETAYMNVLRDAALFRLNANNIRVLREQLRQTGVRVIGGEVTRTDEAQAESSLATARAQYANALSSLTTSVATYRQVIGHEPKHLEPARPIDPLLPPSLSAAIAMALSQSPEIEAALHAVDAAQLEVQLNEGNLYPTVDALGSAQYGTQQQGFPKNRTFQGAALLQLSVPIYTGGETYASIREAKELLTQTQLQADVARDKVRAAVVSSWGQLDALKEVIVASRAAVKASEVALRGVRAEAQAGQRTTLDILVAEQTLLQSRVNLVSAQRDRVVASYAVMAAIGRLSAANLGLTVTFYDPSIHFDQVKDKWFGLRAPSGM